MIFHRDSTASDPVLADAGIRTPQNARLFLGDSVSKRSPVVVEEASPGRNAREQEPS
ncbi:MAG: hypothetical protein GY895_17175 [Phycisphaera sp.]|nr:hypothetical protein [Phycisphaera sp.]